MDEFTIEDIPYSPNGRVKGTLRITDNTNGNMRWKEWKAWPDGYNDREQVIEMLTDYLRQIR